MKAVTNFALAGVIGAAMVMGASGAFAECSGENWKECAGKPWVDGDKMETPLGSRWWPHPIWGEGDEAGSTNWYTKPEIVMRALAMVKQGKVMKIGQAYDAEMPAFGARKFILRIPGQPTGGPFGALNLMYNDEFVATEIGQIGTQFDGLGHIGIAIGSPTDKAGMRWYNGVTGAEMLDTYGLKKNGVEKLHPIVARGILIDIAGARGVEAMEAGQVVTMADVRKALEKQNMANFEFMEGDALFFRTGWETYWIKDNAKYNNGQPGLGMEVARWIAEDVKAGLTGHDSWAGDAVPGKGTPNEVPEGCVFCVHAFLQTRHGIVNHENLKLSELANAGIYQFAYVFSPLPIKGATGSPGSPIIMY